MNKGSALLAEGIRARGMQQAEAAAMVGCSPSFMSHLLKGRKRPGRQIAARISEIFNVRSETWDEEIGSGSESSGARIEIPSTEARSRGESSEDA